jgi:hypothetical protein
MFGSFQLNESAEDGLMISSWNPPAIILNGDEEVSFPTDGNIHTTPPVFQGIAHQIPQDLLNLLLIMAERCLTVSPRNLNKNSVGL